MKKLLLGFVMSLSLITQAQAFTKPTGIPVYSIPDYNVTIAIWVDQHPVGGAAIMIFELQNDNWVNCSICVITPWSGLTQDVPAAGGPEAYVLSKLPEINVILAQRFPAIGGPPVTMPQKVNAVLMGYAYAIVNGSPALIKP